MSTAFTFAKDPMLGMELIVSALLLIAAGSVFGAGVGLARSAPWARPIAIGVAVVLILIAATLPLMTPSGIGGAGPPIHPVSWLLGGTGLALLVLAAKPYRQM